MIDEPQMDAPEQPGKDSDLGGFHVKTVYGPVSSWRLGRSFGVDPICREDKVCSFDCVYCQLGRTKEKTCERREFVSVDDVKKDLDEVLARVEADIITFSGTGEPTLASNLRGMIDHIREVSSLPIAILTNSSLLSESKVRKELYDLDVVVVKLDAHNQELLEKINRPCEEITFEKILGGIKKFRSNYPNKLAVQTMFIDKNKKYASEIASLTREIEPDEVQINTPLRPCPVKPLDKWEIEKIKTEFRGLNAISVYEAEKVEVHPVDLEEVYIRKRPEP